MSQDLQKLLDEVFVLLGGIASLISVIYLCRLKCSSVHVSQENQKEVNLHKNLGH